RDWSSDVCSSDLTWGDGAETTDETQTWLNELKAIPSFMSIDATYYVWNTNVYVEVTVNPVADYTSSNLAVMIGVTEDHHNVTGTTTQNDYYHILRKFLPNGNGTTIGPLTSGVPVSVNESYNFTLGGVAQDNFNIHTSMNELSVIVWVQDMTTKEIHQSVVADFAVSTEDIASQLVQAKLYPNPVNDLATLRINLEESADLSIDVFNSVGAKVYTASK